jgi:capsule polysaccharide export protein KpsE/RkpR
MDRPTDTVAPLVEQPSEMGERHRYDNASVVAGEVVNQPAISSIEIAWLLWNNRRSLFRKTFIGMIVFGLVAFLLPKWYTATTQLMPPDFNTSSALAMAIPALSSDDNSGGSSGGAGGVGAGASITGLASKLLGLNSSGQLFVGVLQSRTIEDEIIKQFGLMKLYSEKYPEDARKRLEELTSVDVDGETGIISVSVEDKNPERAAAMAQAYVADLNQVLARENTSSAHRERVFIEQRLAQVKKQLDASAKEFSQFASANTAIDIPEQAKAMVEAAADLQAQLMATQSMLRGLQQIYTDDNVRVRQMKAQVAELQSQLNKLGGKDVNPDSGSSLPSDELYPSIRQLPLLGVKYLDLYRQSKIDEAVYEFLTKQYEIAKVEEARDIPTVQVLDAAVVPEKKTSPHRLYIILGGMCFSFLFCSAWLVGAGHWERIDPRAPWKVFAEDVYATCRIHTWDSRMGLRFRTFGNRFRKHNPTIHETERENDSIKRDNRPGD